MYKRENDSLFAYFYDCIFPWQLKSNRKVIIIVNTTLLRLFYTDQIVIALSEWINKLAARHIDSINDDVICMRIAIAHQSQQ